MIKILGKGSYKLIKTAGDTKILTLDEDKFFAWIKTESIGEILVYSKKDYESSKVISVGKYRLYSVKNESELTDLFHLELLVQNGRWQGYLLPTGVPDLKKKRSRIIPTKEIITKSIN